MSDLVLPAFTSFNVIKDCDVKGIQENLQWTKPIFGTHVSVSS
jgi:hypothetical protein